jgi:hypothetical protein
LEKEEQEGDFDEAEKGEVYDLTDPEVLRRDVNDI